jgi:thiol-disulfide isomerase/thioredoxin
MNRKVWIAGALVVAVLTPVVMMGVKDRDTMAPQDARAEESRPAAAAASTKAAPPTNVTLPEGSSPTDVYQKLTAEIEVQGEQANRAVSPDEKLRILESIAAKFEAFRSKYPNTPEALDAAFQLGGMRSGMQQFDQAEKYLLEFIQKAESSEHEKLAYAHYYLAEAYKASGKYDAAEAEYKLIIRDFSDVNPRLTNVAQMNLDGLQTERKLAIGSEPVAFEVKSLKGERLSPAAFKGKVLLIDFWATWCGPCIQEMPNVKSVYNKYHAKGFEIVGISLDQQREKLDKYIESQGIEWPQYFDGKWWSNEVAVSYGVKSIPTTILVDKKGKIRFKSLRGKQLEAAVEQLLAEKV